MTDDWTAIVCSRGHGCRPVRVPRTGPPPDWEAERHANEAAYWARNLDEFVRRMAAIRHRRGDERAGRLVADVIEGIKSAQGDDAAVIARDRLSDVWRWAGRSKA